MDAFTPLPSLLGGLCIGLAAALLLLSHGKLAGISGIFAGAVTPSPGEWSWRALFLAGLLVGGLAFAVARPETFSVPPGRSLPLLALGGLLVGVGTRLGGGCTSGHGVCGLALRSSRALVATLVFIATGMVAVLALRVVGGAP